jgi:hypothetical protein
MCDYRAQPVWSVPDGINLRLEDLPLTEATRIALRRWSDWYDNLWEQAFEWKAGEEAAFDREGQRLLQLVRSELGDGWQVELFTEAEC